MAIANNREGDSSMTETTEKKVVTPQTDLVDEVRESAKAGQHSASEALRKFYRTVDEAIPESVQPLRKQIVDAAIDLADQLVTAQYEFHRSIVRSADRALSRSDNEQK
jgi:hypothetical protein